MNVKELTREALEVIEGYSSLDFRDRKVACPYFNNRRAKVRGALGVVVGKGRAEEIIEEAKLMAMRERVELDKLSSEEIREFLVDHNLGIDCSGFVYYILDAEVKAKTDKSLKNFLKPVKGGFLSRIIFKFRVVRNTNVLLLADDKNSKKVDLKNVEPGDFVVMMRYGKEKNKYHILIIESVEYENEVPKVLYYVHSMCWRVDGKYNHGIKKGKIEIIDLNKNLLEQNWIEGVDENETLEKAKKAEVVDIKRLKF